MRIDVVTLFPRMFGSPLSESMIRVAQEKGAIEIRVVDLRDYTAGRHRVADDYPFGGGGGMVLKPEPLFTQDAAARLARVAHLVLLCGHYEGVDERVRAHLADEELSIGDYVLTGGELPTLVVVDAVVRLLPGVLGDPDGPARESFAAGRLDYPQYTRPAEYRGLRVPEVLLSGDHGRIARWRRREAFQRTVMRRPDLLTPRPPSAEERGWFRELTEGATAPESTD